MMPVALLAVILLVAVIFGPQWWVKRTLTRYSSPEDRYSGTGAELARHLLDQAGLQHVAVEPTESGDHYDPIAKAVRLSPMCFDARSLTAITVAAHEVGHALQDASGHAGLRLRTRLAVWMAPLQSIATVVLIAGPILAMLVRAPALFWITVIAAFGLQLLGAVLTFITLPVEWDASFTRALPLLERERILHPGDLPHATRLLRAAAMTYVSASLVSLLFLLRFLR